MQKKPTRARKTTKLHNLLLHQDVLVSLQYVFVEIKMLKSLRKYKSPYIASNMQSYFKVLVDSINSLIFTCDHFFRF